MELMRYFWDAAVELDPDAAKLDEGVRFPLCRPEALDGLFASAGLREVEVTAIDIPTPFASFEDYWQPFLGGQGPAPAYAMSLDEAARARLRDRIRERMPVAGRRFDLVDGPGLGDSRNRAQRRRCPTQRSSRRSACGVPPSVCVDHPPRGR